MNVDQLLQSKYNNEDSLIGSAMTLIWPTPEENGYEIDAILKIRPSIILSYTCCLPGDEVTTVAVSCDFINNFLVPAENKSQVEIGDMIYKMATFTKIRRIGYTSTYPDSKESLDMIFSFHLLHRNDISIDQSRLSIIPSGEYIDYLIPEGKKRCYCCNNIE